jgi:hypothetical protein
VYEQSSKKSGLLANRAFRNTLASLLEDTKNGCELLELIRIRGYMVTQDNFFLSDRVPLDLLLAGDSVFAFAFDSVDLLLAGRDRKNHSRTANAIRSVATATSIYTTVVWGCSLMNRVADTSRGDPSWSMR